MGMGRCATALTLTAFMALATSAVAEDFPARKPGLWEVTTQAAGKVNATTKMCIDAGTDQLFHKFSSDLRSASQHCAKNDVKVSGDTVDVESDCKIGSTTVSTIATTKFAGDTYHAEIKSHFDPAFLGKTDMTVTQDAKWTGECPADMKAGDLILPSGIKVNVKTLNALKALIPGGGK